MVNRFWPLAGVIVMVAAIVLVGLALAGPVFGSPVPLAQDRGPALSGLAQAPASPTRTLPPTVTPTDTLAAPPPTSTPLPTATPGPHEYIIQAGDTCLGIASKYGHVDPQVVDAIEELNNLRDCSLLPGPGSRLLIPYPTATATQVGADLTQTAIATAAPPQVTLIAGPSYSIQQYVVQSGDTLSSIAIINDSSMRQICELNPLPDGIDCRVCQWESPHCCCTRPIIVSEGKVLNVPGPTPTPSPSPTFTGSETPTATPTHHAPQLIYPPDGITVAGAVRLSWLTVGPLAADEQYLVTLRDDTTGAIFNGSTRRLSLDVPFEYLPQDGQAHLFAWQVSVVRPGADGLLYPQGGVVPEQRFTWSGW